MLPTPRPRPRPIPELRLRLAELREEPGLTVDRVDALVEAIDKHFDVCVAHCWTVAAQEGFPDREEDAALLERQLHALSVLRSRALALYAIAH